LVAFGEASDSTTCEDTAGDATGNATTWNNEAVTCDWWAGFPQHYCAFYSADYYDDSDFTAMDMCCSCGGGLNEISASTTQEDTTTQAASTEPIAKSVTTSAAEQGTTEGDNPSSATSVEPSSTGTDKSEIESTSDTTRGFGSATAGAMAMCISLFIQ